MNYPRSHYLRNLRQIDIDNLACGRLTNVAVHEAISRVDPADGIIGPHGCTLLADELNDMLEAAKLPEEKEHAPIRRTTKRRRAKDGNKG